MNVKSMGLKLPQEMESLDETYARDYENDDSYDDE